MNVFAIILGIIGFIVVISIIYYFFKRWAEEERKKQQMKAQWPSDTYMTTVGAQCPDYWNYQGQTDNPNFHVCKNTFNLPLYHSDSKVCYDGENTKTFSTIRR